MNHFVSASCKGETCPCGKPATHKVGEEIQHDDPNQMRHNLTQYVCCTCFTKIMGNATPCEDAIKAVSPPQRPEYTDLVAILVAQPMTFYPGLLAELVTAAYLNNVFVDGGASDMARNVEKRIGKARVWSTEHSDRLDAMISDKGDTWDLSGNDQEMLTALRARLLNLEAALLKAPEPERRRLGLAPFDDYANWFDHDRRQALE